MDDDSPFSTPPKSPLSSSEAAGTSKQGMKLRKKKKKEANFKSRKGAAEDSSSHSSDSDDATRKRPTLSSRSTRRPIVVSASESEDYEHSSGKIVDKLTPMSTSDSSAHSNKFSSRLNISETITSASCSNSPIVQPRNRSKKCYVASDETSSSENLFSVRQGTRRVISDSSSTTSHNTACNQNMSSDDDEPLDCFRVNRKDNKLSSTESSDEDDSPGCAICLSSLVNRIAAQISSCSHEFHNTCILKWSERTNTCPIDRLKFNKITVKNKLGKIVKVTDVEDKVAGAQDDEEQFVAEIINCVICGSSENEDILLLCDGCNRGFHIYCLNPPLDAVPEGNWICENCSPVITLSDSVYFNDELDISIEDYSDNSMQSDMEDNWDHDMSDDVDEPSTSTRPRRAHQSQYQNGSTLTVSVSSRNRNVSRNTRVRQTTITIKQTRKRRQRRRARRSRRQQSTVSSRNRSMALAAAKKASGSEVSKSFRSDTGRPHLSLFSSGDHFDYYNPGGDSDEECEGVQGGSVAVAARTRYPTSRLMDRKSAVARLINTNRRPRVVPRVVVPNASTSVSIMDDIMGMMDVENKKSGEKIPIRKDGTFDIPAKIDVTSDKNKGKVKETPGYPGTGDHGRPRGHYGGPPGGYQNPNYPTRHQSGVFSSRNSSAPFPRQFSSFQGSRLNSEQFNFFRTPPPRFRSNVPPRFPRRSLPASLLIDAEAEQDDPSPASEDVDIYGDIDTTPQNNTFNSLVPPPQPPAGLLDLNNPPGEFNSPSKTASDTLLLSSPPKPPPALLGLGLSSPPEPPASLLGLGSLEEDPSDEEKGLVIDTNAYDPADPCDSPDHEESGDIDGIPIPSPPPPTGDIEAIPIPYQTVSSTEKIDKNVDCPNASLYSSTSLEYAKKMLSMQDYDSDEEIDKKSTKKATPVKQNNTPIRFSITSRTIPPVADSAKRKINLFPEEEDDDTNDAATESDKDEEKVESDKANLISEDSGGETKEIKVVAKESKEDCDENMTEDITREELEEIVDDKSEGDGLDQESQNKDSKQDDDDDDDVIENDETILLDEGSVRDEEEKLLLSDSEILEGVGNTTPDSPFYDKEGEGIDLLQSSPKDSVELSPDKSVDKSVDENFELTKADHVECDTQGDILDLNTDNLHGVSDAHIPEGEEKLEDDAGSKNDSFNCLDGLDVDPISDSEYGSLSDCNQVEEKDSKNEKRKKKKRKLTEREEGEIVEPKKKDRKKDREKDDNDENLSGERKAKKKKDKDKEDYGELSPLQEKTLGNNIDNMDRDTTEVAWKKLSKNTKDRNYREKDEIKNKKKKEARKELERYNVRKVIGDKVFQRKDEFGRDLSPITRSRSLSFGRSPPRKRSLSRDRLKSPIRKNKKRKSHSPSVSRFRRSFSRSPIKSRRRSFSRSPLKSRRRSPSPGLMKSKGKKFLKNRGKSRSYSRHRSRTPKKGRSRSRSKKRRSKSRDKGKSKNKKDKNLEPMPFKNVGKKKNKKKPPPRRSRSKTKKRSKSPRGSSPWDFSSTSISRSPSPAIVARKSRSWSRDNNITVIVPNAKKKEKKKSKDKRRRHRENQSPTLSKEVFTSGDNILVSVNFAQGEKTVGPTTVEKVKPPKKSKKDILAIKAAKVREIAAKAKPVAIIDLDVSPFRERTPSPKEVIVLCDSDSENENSKQAELKASSGPKTPPEPHIKFSISSKNQAINSIANPLLDIEETTGPNTPPEPPSPMPTSPYDPFDPTKSRSPSPISQTAPNEKSDKISNNVHEKELLKPSTPNKDLSASPSKGGTIIVIDDKSMPNQGSNAKQDDKSVTSSMSTALQSSIPVYTSASNGSRGNMNGNIIADLDSDSDGAYSPGSSLGDELFDPPKKSPIQSNKKFDSLFVPKSMPSKPIPYEPKLSKQSLSNTPPKKSTSLKYVPSKTKAKAAVLSKIDEDQLKILDEVPSSAVEMQVKYKYLKKLNRQERVVEEVKIVLKPHYNKKHVTKEQYKEILRKSVPKICHNKSGEINPSKIHNLVEAYVKKYRIHNKKAKLASTGAKLGALNNTNTQLNNASATNGSAKKTMWS